MELLKFYYGKPPFSALSENAVFDKILSLDYTLDHPIELHIPDIVKDIISRYLLIISQTSGVGPFVKMWSQRYRLVIQSPLL